jgi:RIO-like serine/threonine protein kinase
MKIRSCSTCGNIAVPDITHDITNELPSIALRPIRISCHAYLTGRGNLDHPDLTIKHGLDASIEYMWMAYLQESGTVPTLYDAYYCGDTFFMVMDRFEGDLYDLVARNPSRDYTEHVLDLLKKLHQYHIVHGDVHAETIVYRDGTLLFADVSQADWGDESAQERERTETRQTITRELNEFRNTLNRSKYLYSSVRP